MSRLHLVADDLTGALDSAVKFTGCFGTIPVFLDHRRVPAVRDGGIDLGCRDGGEGEAAARTRETAVGFATAEIAFKKIDSLLRGHWAAELHALATLRLFARIVLAPAFPAQGRVTRAGRQYARDQQGAWSVLEIDPAAELVRRGVRVERDLGSEVIGSRMSPVVLCDASSDADLQDLVRHGRERPGPTLWCGTAGLAGALAGRPPRPVAIGGGVHLAIVGSNHPATWRQIDSVAERHPERLVRFDADGARSGALMNETLARHRRVLAYADLPAGLSPASAGAEIDRWIRNLVPHLQPPDVLTVVGGETFARLCAALRVSSIDAEGEWRPGVPASRLSGGPWDRLGCFSKSGAFGEAGLLLALLDGTA